MNSVSSLVNPESTTNKFPMHRFKKCLLSHTAAVAVGIVLILASVAALIAYASSLPILCSILLFTSALIGVALISLGVKYVRTYLSKIDFVDSHERAGYGAMIWKSLLEIQDLQDRVNEQAGDIEKVEQLQEYVKTLHSHITALEQFKEWKDNQQKEMVCAHFEDSRAYERELKKVARKLYEANKKIEQQRLQIPEELKVARERVQILEWVQLRLSRDLQYAANMIQFLQEEAEKVPPKPRSRSASI
ncbi:IncA family protein [Chlamydia caviae]|nr:IncA family protein [Chlamydia caviae]